MRARNRRGQVIVEYLILVAFLIVGLAAIFAAFPAALNTFLSNVLRIVALPIL